MAGIIDKSFSRRKFIRTSAAAAAGITVMPYLGCSRLAGTGPVKRTFGRIGREVTTLGLGGQASIQWTPEDVNPVKIILKAFNLGVNYFDTSNLYGPSQLNYGKAFRELGLIPDRQEYDESLRRSIFLTSKTRLFWGKGEMPGLGVRSASNGGEGLKTADDIRRSLSQMFGDGEGYYPRGAYLDMVLVHSLSGLHEVEALYTGLDDTDPAMENIGALAVLRDLRDGSNLTGMNPEEEKLIRHIGFSGHYSAPVMMEMIRRDKHNLLDGMLIAVNANDRLNLNMQYNVLPVAMARNMGVIGMKVFADGAMYSKEAHWSREPGHVVRTVGSPELPSGPLIGYTLTVPGVHTAIIGIGQIDDDPAGCQLEQNLAAAQVKTDGLSEQDRREIEKLTAKVKDGKTNYFQVAEGSLTPVTQPAANQSLIDGKRSVSLTWHTAYAGDEAIREYEVWRDEHKLTSIPFVPQVTASPFLHEEELNDMRSHVYRIVTVDNIGRRAETEPMVIESL